MKKSNRSSLLVFLCALCFIVALTSCTSAKQLTYLHDVTPNQTIKGAPKTLNGNIVHVDGTIQLPLLGKVPVEGKSISEAEDQIRLSAKDYLKEVSVRVRVLTYK